MNPNVTTYTIALGAVRSPPDLERLLLDPKLSMLIRDGWTIASHLSVGDDEKKGSDAIVMLLVRPEPAAPVAPVIVQSPRTGLAAVFVSGLALGTAITSIVLVVIASWS